jgi:hypothetical protein
MHGGKSVTHLQQRQRKRLLLQEGGSRSRFRAKYKAHGAQKKKGQAKAASGDLR